MGCVRFQCFFHRFDGVDGFSLFLVLGRLMVFMVFRWFHCIPEYFGYYCILFCDYNGFHGSWYFDRFNDFPDLMAPMTLVVLVDLVDFHDFGGFDVSDGS